MKKNIKKTNALNPPKTWTNIEDTEKHQRYKDVYTLQRLGKLASYTQKQDGIIDIYTENNITLRIEFWRADMCRVRYLHPYTPQFPNYALDSDFNRVPPKIEIQKSDHCLDVKGGNIQCSVNLLDCKLEFTSLLTSTSILKEVETYCHRSSIMTGTNQVKICFDANTEDKYLGLGDKSGNLNLNGHYFQNWNTDAFAFDKDKNPLYRSIPFYYGVKNEQIFGLFLNNSYESHFDFNSSQDKQTKIWADGGEMDYFFFHGNGLNEVASAYHHLTGKPELPPLWSLGFHQCRWSYFPESRVMELAKQFRTHQIPCDALYLDIDYMDDYRCFTWNNDYFPTPDVMIGNLKENGFHTVVMIDPGIKVEKGYDIFESGLKENAFCQRANGELMIGPVWPSQCVWPDFTNNNVRKWWGLQYEDLYLKDGVSGFWNDMNEPAVFKINHGTFPDDVLHNNDGHPSNHKAVHNIYGQQMSRATTDGLKQLNPTKRPFVLARASFSGGQRYAALWTGDNVANWEQLRLANRQCQRLSISGFSFVGTDIGGFVDQPEPALLIRWLQLSVFHPLFRIHSMGNNDDGSAETDKESVVMAESKNRQDREPWSFGEPYTSQARKAIGFRYQLLPYLYTAFYTHALDGLPIIRSLSFENPKDQETYLKENEFLFGNHLLVNPVTIKRAKNQNTYLPFGDWLDYETGECFSGNQSVKKEVNENSIPIYIRAGAVIPHYPVQQYTNELKIDNVILKAYFGKEQVESHFYQDKGEGYEYQDGQFRLHTFTTHSNETSFTIEQQLKGTPKDDLLTFEVKVYGLPFEVNECYIDGVQINIIDEEPNAIVVVAPVGFMKIEIKN